MSLTRKAWTVRQIQAEGACYDAKRITTLWAGREALTLWEILDLDIPAVDRLWVCWRPGALTDAQFAAVMERIVGRAVRQFALSEPSTHDWAQRWLDGDPEARTAAEAARVAWAAGAAWAAEAAWAAGAAWAAAGAAAGAAEYDRQLADVLAVLNGVSQ